MLKHDDSNSNADGTLKLCRWALGYALRRWQNLLAVVGVMMLGIAFAVLGPWPMKVLVDNVLNGQPLSAPLAEFVGRLPYADTREQLAVWCVGATVALFLAGWSLGLLGAFVGIPLAQRMSCDLAADLFAHLQRMSLRFHARNPNGDLVHRVTNDCSAASVIVRDALLPVFASLIGLASMFWIMWRMDPVLTIVSLAIVPFMILCFRRYAGPMMQRTYRQQAAEGRMYATVEETLSAMPVVQAFGREADNDARLRAGTSAVLAATMDTTDVELRFKVMMGLATAAGTAGILWLGAHRVVSGGFTVGEMLVFIAYLGSLYAPLQSIMYTTTTIQGAAGSARRVLEVLRTASDVDDNPSATPLERVGGLVKLENVTVGYDPNRPVLKNVSLEVRPGETVAVVGATGAGKTTLVSLVPRFLDPWQGRVTIDGRDVRGATVRSVRENVALVLQEPFLFPISIAENIAYGRPDATRAQIEAAARAANALAFIERLPKGYDTVVGERGATLSGGERQRLSIARALLIDAPILILDEPTSALDAETESLLLEALGRLTARRTTLIVAHRLSTIRNADRIIVLSNGEIAETGSHDELLRRGGLYADFYNARANADAAIHGADDPQRGPA
jgi:ATP-binding cassette subfamily B protein/subfamily B ATP-binding cassette protein MsbA